MVRGEVCKGLVCVKIYNVLGEDEIKDLVFALLFCVCEQINSIANVGWFVNV